MEQQPAQIITEEQRKAAANLHMLAMRQVSMGVPEDLAVCVFAAAAGSVAASLGWDKSRLANLLAIMEAAWEGQKRGEAARVTEGGG
jgi:hypothetical protein